MSTVLNRGLNLMQEDKMKEVKEKVGPFVSTYGASTV